MKKAAMNRKKRLDAPSKQESRERYESARRQNSKEDAKDDLLSSTSELPKRPREDANQDMESQSSALRGKIPKFSRTIAGNDETGSLVVNIGKKDTSSTLSLVDPSYDDTRMPVEKFNYSHKRSDVDPVDDDDDDLRSLIERQRKTDKHSEISKKDDKNPKKSGSTFYDSKFGYTKEHPKSKTSDNYRDSKKKDSKDNKSASGKSDRYSKHDAKSKNGKGKGQSKSSYELGFPFFSSSGSKNKDKPADEMDINETLKELAYLRSIQTGDNALPQEEEEYFRKLNDLSKPNLAGQFDLLSAEKTSLEKTDGGRKTSSETLSKIESKWDSVIDSMMGKKAVGNTTNDDEKAYGPSLPPKKSSVTSKKDLGSTSTEKSYSRERSLSNSKPDHKTSPIAVRGGFRGRGFRGRGMRGSFRGRGRGRGAQDFGIAFRGRGRGRSRGRFIRGGFIPSRGRHIFAKGGAKSRKSRSRSSSRGRSRSSSYSRSRSRSRSRGRSNKRRRSSSRSSYSSSSYSRSRSRSRDRTRGRKQTRKRSRSRSYSSSSRSRSRSGRRSRSRSTSHSRSRKRSRSLSRSRGSFKKQSKDRERSRSRSKGSSRSRSRKRKDRSRSWSFDEDYTKKKNTKTTSSASGAKTTDAKTTAKKEQEVKAQSRPKKEKTETGMAKPKNKDKPREPKLEQTNQAQGKKREKIPEISPENPSEKPKGDNCNSPAVVALKDLKVTAYSNVFLPRTVSKNVGNISKGMSIAKGRMLPLKKHPLFDAQEEEPQEEPEKIDPKELERMKEEKQKFDSEVDKVFNIKSGSKDADKRGSWKRVWPPEESPKNEETLQEQEQENEESVETKYEEVEEEIVVEDQRIVETKDTTEEKKTEKEQKKERKEKRRKEKEEKMKRKKEKKEKKGKKNKESTTQENLGNESKEKELVDDGQAVVDSTKPEQYNQEGYSGYGEYPEGEYQYYEEAGQEQGWYDENGVYHPYEEEYLYYCDQEGNIVGYEGPEGYVEGNPFEEQQYYYEGEQQQGGVQPDMYGQEAYGTEYPGEAEGSYHYQVEGQAVEEPQYAGADSHWQEYTAVGPEQQWYAAEGSYPQGGEGYAEYQYAENYPEQQVPVEQDPIYMVPQQDSAQSFAAAPAQAAEEPKSEDLSENELVLALGKNLAALARLKGWNQKEILDQDPLSIVKMLQKPAVEKLEEPARRPVQQDRPLEEPYRELQEKPVEAPRQHRYNTRQKDKARLQKTQEQSQTISESRVIEEKPLKSILKKGNSTSLKPPIKPETTASPLLQKDTSTATSDHVGPEYIVRISKSGPERFFCKLCQCHIESSMAKELHVKSMKHIELFVREKSSLLHSVIGAKQQEDAGLPSQQDKLTEKEPQGSPPRDHDKRDEHESSDTAEEEAARNRLLDYDRLRLMDWQRREGSVGSVESDKLKRLDYGRAEDQDLESRTSREEMERERYEDRDGSRWPRESREDWRQHEESYRRERQRYAPERRERDYEKGDYHRERRSLSHDSDRQDDRRSIGSRSSDRSYDGSEKDTRSEHKSQPMTYRNRIAQDVRNSPRDRTQGEISQRGHREQTSREEQTPGISRSDKSRETLNQNERGRDREDAGAVAGAEERRRTNFSPQENSGHSPQDKWPGHGQASRDRTRQNPDRKAQEASSLSSSSSRAPSSERKEMPRAEDSGRRESSEKMKQSSPTVERNQSQKTSRDGDSHTNIGGVPKDGTQMSSESYPERAGTKPLPSIQSQKEPTNQQAPSSNVKPLAALLGDPPKAPLQDPKPQEQAKSISTVIQGQRRVPPPPPPYNKGSGPQSFRGRGGQGHVPPRVGRGGHQPHIPPSQPGMMGEAPHTHTLLPMTHQVPSYKVGTPATVPPSSMPPRQFPGDQAIGGHPTPPFYGRGRAVGQPQFRGRGVSSHMGRGVSPLMARGGGPHMVQGGSPHMAQGGSYGGSPQFASRGRGGRGYHGQRW